VTSCSGCLVQYHDYMARNRIALCISLPSDLAAELDAICDKEDRTRSELVRKVLRSYLNDRLWQLAESLNKETKNGEMLSSDIR
jgi:metal-responsive CopG/Arc/MetJ family transcriptional regulator